MALVTVHRTPTPSISSDIQESDEIARNKYDGDISPKNTCKPFSLSENYLTVKGAALILSPTHCRRRIFDSHQDITDGQTVTSDIHRHLQSMFCLLRSYDTIKLAVRLESVCGHFRYMTIVSTTGNNDQEECAIIGFDITDDKPTVGLVIPVWTDLDFHLDGDGGFSVSSNNQQYVMKPVSVQAMWSALQSVSNAQESARLHNYYVNGLTHTWVNFYLAHINSSQSALNEWHQMEDIESHKRTNVSNLDALQLEKRIRNKLKDIMMTVDLEEVTSKYLRNRLEQELEMKLSEYKHFIDEEMIIVMRQMDAPSQIFDYLYLGSEWNASNLEELRNNSVSYILNVTREIDNFFPGMFKYCNVRVVDCEDTELIKHWHRTFPFIDHARRSNSRVLVHCKMGVSRSASTVIAYVMKAYDWRLDKAYAHVKAKRNCIKPNDGFMLQLSIYEGILDASKQRHSGLWQDMSVASLHDGDEQVTKQSKSVSSSPNRELCSALINNEECGPVTPSSCEDNTLSSDYVMPLIFTIEDWQNYDNDDCDTISDFEEESSNDDSTVKLISHVKYDWTVICDQMTRDGQSCDINQTESNGMTLDSQSCDMNQTENNVMTQDSQSCDKDQDMEQPTSVRGFYDVSMLTNESLDYRLHPDSKLEHIMYDYHKQRLIANQIEPIRYDSDCEQCRPIAMPHSGAAVSQNGSATTIILSGAIVPISGTAIPFTQCGPVVPQNGSATTITQSGAIVPMSGTAIPFTQCGPVVPLCSSEVTEGYAVTDTVSLDCDNKKSKLCAPCFPIVRPDDFWIKEQSISQTTEFDDMALVGSESTQVKNETVINYAETEFESEKQFMRPLSVYELEEISVEPGMVQRTKLEIERRERSSSLVDITVCSTSPVLNSTSPVQRSSSLRIPRNAKTLSDQQFPHARDRRPVSISVAMSDFSILKESNLSPEAALINGVDLRGPKMAEGKIESVEIDVGVKSEEGLVESACKEQDIYTACEEHSIAGARAQEERATAGLVKSRTKEMIAKAVPPGQLTDGKLLDSSEDAELCRENEILVSEDDRRFRESALRKSQVAEFSNIFKRSFSFNENRPSATSRPLSLLSRANSMRQRRSDDGHCVRLPVVSSPNHCDQITNNQTFAKSFSYNSPADVSSSCSKHSSFNFDFKKRLNLFEKTTHADSKSPKLGRRTRSQDSCTSLSRVVSTDASNNVSGNFNTLLCADTCSTVSQTVTVSCTDASNIVSCKDICKTVSSTDASNIVPCMDTCKTASPAGASSIISCKDICKIVSSTEIQNNVSGTSSELDAQSFIHSANDMKRDDPVVASRVDSAILFSDQVATLSDLVTTNTRNELCQVLRLADNNDVTSVSPMTMTSNYIGPIRMTKLKLATVPPERLILTSRSSSTNHNPAIFATLDSTKSRGDSLADSMAAPSSMEQLIASSKDYVPVMSAKKLSADCHPLVSLSVHCSMSDIRLASAASNSFDV